MLSVVMLIVVEQHNGLNCETQHHITFSMLVLIMTYNVIEHSAKCHYSDCLIFIVILNVVMPNVITLNVVAPSVDAIDVIVRLADEFFR
jgi:hypothetical protein